MPRSQRSLNLTTAYRKRLDATRERLQRLAVERWPTIESLDTTDWVDRTAAAVAQAQVEALRATGGYLTAFLSSELGKPTRGPAIDSREKAGLSRDGRPLRDSLQSPIIGTLSRLKAGRSPEIALRYGLDRAKRQVGMDFDHAHRSALLEAIDKDERFDGWQRALRGTCGACAAVAARVEHGLAFPVHPGCHCVSEPVVRGVANLAPRATGAELFAQKSQDEQDEMLGPEAAALVRSGAITLDQLVERSELETGEDFITQKPVDRLIAT